MKEEIGEWLPQGLLVTIWKVEAQENTKVQHNIVQNQRQKTERGSAAVFRSFDQLWVVRFAGMCMQMHVVRRVRGAR